MATANTKIELYLTSQQKQIFTEINDKYLHYPKKMLVLKEIVKKELLKICRKYQEISNIKDSNGELTEKGKVLMRAFLGKEFEVI